MNEKQVENEITSAIKGIYSNDELPHAKKEIKDLIYEWRERAKSDPDNCIDDARLKIGGQVKFLHEHGGALSKQEQTYYWNKILIDELLMWAGLSIGFSKNHDKFLTVYGYFFYLLGQIHSMRQDMFREKILKRQYAYIRHSKDPKQQAKNEILNIWQKQRETIIAKRGKAQFYRDMQNKYKDKDGNDLIKDVKTIQGWITDWERTLL